jgi:hypothetical protein
LQTLRGGEHREHFNAINRQRVLRCRGGVVFTWAVAQTQDARPQYKFFRYDEDWSSFAHSTNQRDWLDPLKYIRLGKEGRYLTLGGSMQEKYELLNQPGFGTGPYDPNGYLL